MLHSHFIDNQEGKSHDEQRAIPVFLHGFLGSNSDWDDCLAYLELPRAIRVDLPCHGMSKYCEVEDFSQACHQIQLTVLSQLKKENLPLSTPLVFIGYSLGARIAMYGLTQQGFNDLNIKGAVFEGGNFGLQAEVDKVLRWENDKHWAKRFATEAIDDVLLDWYHQGVFSSLTTDQRYDLVELRSDNLGSQLGCMLRATSLSKQPYLLDDLKQLEMPLLYICGDQDQKFKTLAGQSGLLFQSIKHAGHNVHHEQPAEFAALISDFIHQLK